MVKKKKKNRKVGKKGRKMELKEGRCFVPLVVKYRERVTKIAFGHVRIKTARLLPLSFRKSNVTATATQPSIKAKLKLNLRDFTFL